jgi:hypothetical protein
VRFKRTSKPDLIILLDANNVGAFSVFTLITLLFFGVTVGSIYQRPFVDKEGIRARQNLFNYY